VSLGGHGAGVVGDSHHSGPQVIERVAQPAVGQLVPNTPPDRDRDDESAVPQARQMVRQPRPADAQLVRHLGRMCRTILQDQQQSATDRISQRAAETGQDLDITSNRQHPPDDT